MIAFEVFFFSFSLYNYLINKASVISHFDSFIRAAYIC